MSMRWVGITHTLNYTSSDAVGIAHAHRCTNIIGCSKRGAHADWPMGLPEKAAGVTPTIKRASSFAAKSPFGRHRKPVPSCLVLYIVYSTAYYSTVQKSRSKCSIVCTVLSCAVLILYYMYYILTIVLCTVVWCCTCLYRGLHDNRDPAGQLHHLFFFFSRRR